MPVPPDEVDALVEVIKPLLAGRPAELVGGALADLVSIFLVSHVVLDEMDEISRDATDKLRADLLEEHVTAVKKLIPVNESMLMEKRDREN